MILRHSLRARLMALVLGPLILVACALGYWRYTAAVETAEDLFDRSLLAATLAISRDVTVSGGDALSVTTRDLIARAAGGQVFYHVSGPDRAYVTGYAYPPVPPADLSREMDRPVGYVSVSRGAPVRALRLFEETVAGPLRGLATVTVWQRTSEREAFARALALQSALLLALILGAVAVITWFGVRFGLQPLVELEAAIASRSSSDLSRIRRAVPREVRGIVRTLNVLFGQVQEAMRARDAFLSNAAHQLRNPVAGMLALTEAARSAGTETERRRRLDELHAAATRTARLTTQMLTFERVRSPAGAAAFERLDLNTVIADVAARAADQVMTDGVAFDFAPARVAVPVLGDRLMLEEAVGNLIDNARCHGGPRLTRIEVRVALADGTTVVSVINDGANLSPVDAGTAFERFSQVGGGEGSGLGLAIVAEVAATHGGAATIDPALSGASVSLRLPLNA